MNEALAPVATWAKASIPYCHDDMWVGPGSHSIIKGALARITTEMENFPGSGIELLLVVGEGVGGVGALAWATEIKLLTRASVVMVLIDGAWSGDGSGSDAGTTAVRISASGDTFKRSPLASCALHVRLASGASVPCCTHPQCTLSRTDSVPADAPVMILQSLYDLRNHRSDLARAAARGTRSQTTDSFFQEEMRAVREDNTVIKHLLDHTRANTVSTFQYACTQSELLCSSEHSCNGLERYFGSWERYASAGWLEPGASPSRYGAKATLPFSTRSFVDWSNSGIQVGGVSASAAIDQWLCAALFNGQQPQGSADPTALIRFNPNISLNNIDSCKGIDCNPTCIQKITIGAPENGMVSDGPVSNLIFAVFLGIILVMLALVWTMSWSGRMAIARYCSDRSKGDTLWKSAPKESGHRLSPRRISDLFVAPLGGSMLRVKDDKKNEENMALPVPEPSQDELPRNGSQQINLHCDLPRDVEPKAITIAKLSLSIGSNNNKIQTRILDDISLRVDPKQMTMILGHQPSGMSTLLRVMSGTTIFDQRLERQKELWFTSGVILFGENRLESMKCPSSKRLNSDYCYFPRLSYVPPQNSERSPIVDALTVRENLCFMSEIIMPKVCPEEKRKQVELVLKIMDLDDVADVLVRQDSQSANNLKSISDLSEAQELDALGPKELRKLFISLHLLVDPAYLLLDNPVEGIQHHEFHDILKCLSQWSKARLGCSVLIALPLDFLNQQVWNCFDSAIMLCRGKVGYCGTVSGCLRFMRASLDETPNLNIKRLLQECSDAKFDSSAVVLQHMIMSLKSRSIQAHLVSCFERSNSFSRLAHDITRTVVSAIRNECHVGSNFQSLRQTSVRERWGHFRAEVWTISASLLARTHFKSQVAYFYQSLGFPDYLSLLWACVVGVSAYATDDSQVVLCAFLAHNFFSLTAICLLADDFARNHLLTTARTSLDYFARANKMGKYSVGSSMILFASMRNMARLTIMPIVTTTMVISMTIPKKLDDSLGIAKALILSVMLEHAWFALMLFIQVVIAHFPSRNTTGRLANGLGCWLTLVSVYFNGVMVPESALPDFCAWILYINPVYYSIRGISELLLKNTSFPCEFSSEMYCWDKQGNAALGRYFVRSPSLAVCMVALLIYCLGFYIAASLTIARLVHFDSVIYTSAIAPSPVMNNSVELGSPKDVNKINGDLRKLRNAFKTFIKELVVAQLESEAESSSNSLPPSEDSWEIELSSLAEVPKLQTLFMFDRINRPGTGHPDIELLRQTELGISSLDIWGDFKLQTQSTTAFSEGFETHMMHQQKMKKSKVKLRSDFKACANANRAEVLRGGEQGRRNHKVSFASGHRKYSYLKEMNNLNMANRRLSVEAILTMESIGSSDSSLNSRSREKVSRERKLSSSLPSNAIYRGKLFNQDREINVSKNNRSLHSQSQVSIDYTEVEEEVSLDENSSEQLPSKHDPEASIDQREYPQGDDDVFLPSPEPEGDSQGTEIQSEEDEKSSGPATYLSDSRDPTKNQVVRAVTASADTSITSGSFHEKLAELEDSVSFHVNNLFQLRCIRFFRFAMI